MMIRFLGTFTRRPESPKGEDTDKNNIAWYDQKECTLEDRQQKTPIHQNGTFENAGFLVIRPNPV